MAINHPCKECIVRASCRQKCKELFRYKREYRERMNKVDSTDFIICGIALIIINLIPW